MSNIFNSPITIPHQVYIIGGIVDRVAERGIPKEASREAANKEGIKSVRLPIDRYVK